VAPSDFRERCVASEIFRLADEYVHQWSELHPESSLELGTRTTIDRLQDRSPAGASACADLDRRTLDRVRVLVPTSEDDRRAASYMEMRLEAARVLRDANEHLRPLGTWGPFHQVRQVFDQLQKEAAGDWSVVGELLAHVPDAIAGLIETLELGRSHGVVASLRQVNVTTEATAAWSKTDEHGYFSALARASSCDIGEASSRAAAAFGDASRYLRDVYAADAGDQDGVGPDAYDRWCHEYLGGTIDTTEAYAWAWDQFRSLDDEVRRECSRIEPGADFRRAREVLVEESAGWIEGSEPLRAWAQETMDRIIDELDGVHFDIPPPVRSIEVLLQPPDSRNATYYSPPSEDFSTPGRTWLATWGQERTRPMSLLSTLHHEGAPGHHLQNGQVRVQVDSLSRFQRAFYLNFHGEGWALYAEQLMDELGYLEQPEARLSMLSGQLIRAARVILDLGLHLGLAMDPSTPQGEAWSFPSAVAFLEALRISTAGATHEVNRYLGAPAQAITYSLGQRAWIQAREASQTARGPAFTLTDFHERALALGPLGVTDLASTILDAQGLDGSSHA
jgi:uncharacterized protein (DUF885 family)